MPHLVTLAIGSPSDDWLRTQIRGGFLSAPPVLQRVIVEDFREASRITYKMAQLKHARQRPYGGSTIERIA